MAFDINQFLTDMGFSAAEAAEMAAKFTGERSTKLERLHTRASEYDTREAEITKLQTEAREVNEKLNAEMAEWAALTAKEQSQLPGLRAEIEQGRMRATQLETRLSALATEVGRDPKKVLEGIAEPPPKKEEPKVEPIDTSKFVDLDRFAAVSQFTLELPATLQYIAQEHQALFGKPLDTREIVAEIRARSGKKDAVIDPVKIWEEKHGVSARRDQVAKDRYEADIKAAEERGAERERTNMSVPGATPPGRHSPAFGPRNAQGTVQNRQSALNRPQPGSVASNAAAAFRSGKYRQASR